MLALRSGTLQEAFSDRGYRFTLTEPDLPDATRQLDRQLVQPGDQYTLTDIEAATRAPDGGHCWLAYEQTHLMPPLHQRQRG